MSVISLQLLQAQLTVMVLYTWLLLWQWWFLCVFFDVCGLTGKVSRAESVKRGPSQKCNPSSRYTVLFCNFEVFRLFHGNGSEPRCTCRRISWTGKMRAIAETTRRWLCCFANTGYRWNDNALPQLFSTKQNEEIVLNHFPPCLLQPIREQTTTRFGIEQTS